MIKESYTENFYSYNSKYINNALALRPPQHECLEIFARLCDTLCDTLSLAKNLSYLTEKEAVKVMRDRQKTIAENIYAQMKQHFFRDETYFRASEMRPFSRIETSFGGKFRSDEIYDLRANIPPGEVRQKIFNGFTKACHTLYKFDSNTERNFAIVLENDKDILKWMRPSPKQFNQYK